MGQNNKAGGNSPIFNIQARPEEHNAVIDRQGQWARVIHSKPCSCISNGKVNVMCDKCNGRGFIYYFQSEKDIVEEDSPHYGQNIIYPYFTPITKVSKVQRKLSVVQGGNKNYTIDSFTDTEIFISGQPTPNAYEILQCSYKYNNFDYRTESFIYDDTDSFVLDLTIDKLFQEESDQNYWQSDNNSFGVQADISRVVEFKNVTKDEVYDNSLITINKQIIYLDTAEITIESGDYLEIQIEYMMPEKIATTQLSSKKMLEKWGTDIESGDVDATLKSNTDIKDGDIITFLTSAQTKSSSMIRTNKTYDEIPEFDVIEILENIKDEDDTVYIKDTDFRIEEYNNLVWLTDNKPTKGKKFAIIYSYKLAYIVFGSNKRYVNNESKHFPKNILLKLYDRVKNKEMKIDG